VDIKDIAFTLCQGLFASLIPEAKIIVRRGIGLSIDESAEDEACWVLDAVLRVREANWVRS